MKRYGKDGDLCSISFISALDFMQRFRKNGFFYPISISMGASPWSDAATASESDDGTGAISIVASSATILQRKREEDEVSTIVSLKMFTRV